MRRVAVLLISGAAAALLAQPALGKGPIEATVEGPGLAAPLQFGDWDDWGQEDALAPHQPIMQFAEATGFFPAAFGQVPSPMLDGRPEGNLGPRYVIRYRVPGPATDEFRIVQDLYPYAKPNPVTYMPPKQPLFETGGTSGGWYAAANPAVAPLLSQLIDAGLPETPATGGDRASFPWATAGALAAAAALLGLAVVAVVLVRRRPHPAT
jgi:hypothetical protein